MGRWRCRFSVSRLMVATAVVTVTIAPMVAAVKNHWLSYYAFEHEYYGVFPPRSPEEIGVIDRTYHRLMARWLTFAADRLETPKNNPLDHRRYEDVIAEMRRVL